MRRNAIIVATILLGVCGCGRSTGEQQQSQESRTQSASRTPAADLPRPDDQVPRSRPYGPTDPNNAEAAGQIVQSYGALVEQQRWSEANALWGDAESAEKLASELRSYGKALHFEIGNPAHPEGAAGSIYLTVPVIFYGDLEDGQPFRRSADVILRRVNDVPGSTDEQRRWHIERIDWNDGT